MKIASLCRHGRLVIDNIYFCEYCIWDIQHIGFSIEDFNQSCNIVYYFNTTHFNLIEFIPKREWMIRLTVSDKGELLSSDAGEYGRNQTY